MNSSQVPGMSRNPGGRPRADYWRGLAMQAWKPALLLVPLVLVVWGCHGIFVAWKCRSTVELTYAQYLQKKPVHGWLRLKDVRVDLRRAVGLQDSEGVVKEALVPVEPVSNVKGTTWPVYIVLATRDPETVFIVDQMALMERTKQVGPLAAYLATHRQAICRTRDIEGMAGPDPPSSAKADRKTFRQVGALEEDYVVVVEGKRPRILVPLGILLAGLLAACGLYLIFEPTAEAEDGHRAPAPKPDAPAQVRSPHQTMDFYDGQGTRRRDSGTPAARPAPPEVEDEDLREPASAAEAELMEILRSPAPARKTPPQQTPPGAGEPPPEPPPRDRMPS